MTILEYKRYKKKSLKRNKGILLFGKRSNRKATKKNKRSRAKFVLGSMVLVLILGLFGKLTYSFFTTSPLFRIGDIRVIKDEGLKDFDFEKAAKVKGEESLFMLDPSEVVETFKKNPWVNQVAVRKVFPGKLVVILSKREPVAMINLDGLYFVDEKGKIIKKVSRYDTKVYPVITGFDKKIINGKEGKQNLLRALKVRNMLKGSVVEGNISEINYRADEGSSIVLRNSGLRVKLGSRGLERAFARLEKYYDKIQSHRKDAGYVDLKYPGKIIIGKKKGK